LKFSPWGISPLYAPASGCAREAAANKRGTQSEDWNQEVVIMSNTDTMIPLVTATWAGRSGEQLLTYPLPALGHPYVSGSFGANSGVPHA
jgi:hypothetical protein